MSEHVIQQALKIFEDQEKRRLPPSLAVLGPPGSGKSLFLGRLLSVLRNDAACAEKPSLMINLENIRVGSQADTYVYLNQELLKEATAIGISVDFDIRTQPSHLRFEEILRHLLKAVEGYLIIFIDHLERVPRVFASDLSHRFRNFLESTESDSDYRRLGLVIAGAVSLFELKQSPDSAFQMLPVISFPPLGPDTRKDFVEDYLKSYMSPELPSELIACLADMTGGEPGFLEPLIMNIRKNNLQVALTEELLVESALEICSSAQIPALRNLAFHLHGDKGLRDIVAELKKSRAVTPRSVVPDIDRYQLSGAVVVGRGPYNQSREYQFRNRITAMFLTQLHDLLSAKCEPQSDIPIWMELQKIEAAKSECLNARQIWKWLKTVQEAWTLITPYAIPNLTLYLGKTGSDEGWWFDADVKGISGPELRKADETSTAKAIYMALQNTLLALSPDAETFRAFVESDNENISISIPLYARDLRIILCATLSKTDAGRGMTEFDVWHWIRFVQNVKQVVLTLALAELGQKMLQEPRPRNEISEPADPIDKYVAKHVYLYSQGAIIKDRTNVAYIAGGLTSEDVENLNGRCLKLMGQWSQAKEFEAEVRAIANQLETTLMAKFQSLSASLAPAATSSHTVIISDLGGLKIPFELFPHGGSHLALTTGISRQIMGYSLRPDVALSFGDLLQSLVKQKQELCVLLVASLIDASRAPSEEQRYVRNHIKAGCERMDLPVRFVEIGPGEAKFGRVENELIRNGPFHIVHYTGHGHHYAEGTDLSGIVLSGPEDEAEVVTCKQLRAWFSAAKPWLVYLSCCNSSATSGRTGLSERYIGMIDAVAQAGVPNIVGFRCMVSDRSALHLADEFYRQIFEVQTEQNPSLAMLEARRTVERQPDFFDAWASSMLITQYS